MSLFKHISAYYVTLTALHISLSALKHRLLMWEHSSCACLTRAFKGEWLKKGNSVISPWFSNRLRTALLSHHFESVPFTWCDSQTLPRYTKFTLTYTYTLVSLSIKLELSMVIFNESIETIVGDVNSEEDGINLKWTWLAKNHHQNMNN